MKSHNSDLEVFLKLDTSFGAVSLHYMLGYGVLLCSCCAPNSKEMIMNYKRYRKCYRGC